MLDKAKLFTELRKTLYAPKIEPNETTGTEAILAAMHGLPLSHCAYGLATAYHETNKTMQPVREAYWLPEDWRRKNLRYWPWYGRGLVQITWKPNYEKLDAAAAAAGLIEKGDILADPDLAMRPDLAAFAMRHGMVEGWFVPGRTLLRYLPDRKATIPQFEAARRIINGNDKAHLVATYALQFQADLDEAGWP